MISTWQAKRWIQNHHIFVCVCLNKYKAREKNALRCHRKKKVERNCACWKTGKAHILGVDVRGHVPTHDQFQCGRLSASYLPRRDGLGLRRRINIGSSPHFPSSVFFCSIFAVSTSYLPGRAGLELAAAQTHIFPQQEFPRFVETLWGWIPTNAVWNSDAPVLGQTFYSMGHWRLDFSRFIEKLFQLCTFG